MKKHEKIIRNLVIKSFHISNVVDSGTFNIERLKPSKNIVTTDLNELPYYELNIDSGFTAFMNKSSDLIVDSSIKVIRPDEHDMYVNSIMDVIPISVKTLGRIGEGITNTLTGVYVILTGHDVDGNQVCAFGNSDGKLGKQIMFGRAGTPNNSDILILVDVCLKSMSGYERSGPNAIHLACDMLCDQIRAHLKELKGRDCTESHLYCDVIRPNARRVAIIKMVPGQGAMYDCRYLANNPSGFSGGHSVIDAEGAPMILSPNEYRDGAIRALV